MKERAVSGRVVFDRFRGDCRPVDVRFAPKAPGTGSSGSSRYEPTPLEAVERVEADTDTRCLKAIGDGRQSDAVPCRVHRDAQRKRDVMLQSRREFLTGAVLSTAFPGNLVALSADAALLATLSPYELELVLQSMAN